MGAALPKMAESTEEEQLRLRFFAVVDRYRANPPEKALMRELLDCALRSVERFMVGARPVAASAVHHVGAALYFRSDSEGIVQGFSVQVIAADTRRTERSVISALAVLRRLHVFRSTRTSRRSPATHRINVGGLDWPAVRARGNRASGDTVSLLSHDTVSPLKGYNGEIRRTTNDVRPAGGNPQRPLEAVPGESETDSPGFVFLPADDPRAFDADEGGDWWRDGRRACDTSPNTTED